MEEYQQQRMQLICRLIRSEAICTQLDLQKRMADSGIKVSQATLSRDLKELGINRKRDRRGMLRYILDKEEMQTATEREYTTPLGMSKICGSIATAGAVLHTPAGQATTIARWIDNLKLPAIAGTIAGEDTVLLLLFPNHDPIRLLESLKIRIKTSNSLE